MCLTSVWTGTRNEAMATGNRIPEEEGTGFSVVADIDVFISSLSKRKKLFLPGCLPLDFQDHTLLISAYSFLQLENRIQAWNAMQTNPFVVGEQFCCEKISGSPHTSWVMFLIVLLWKGKKHFHQGNSQLAEQLVLFHFNFRNQTQRHVCGDPVLTMVIHMEV